MSAKLIVVLGFTMHIVSMVHGAGEVVASLPTPFQSTSTGTCPAGGNVCSGTLTLCANTVAPSTSGTCQTFGASATIPGDGTTALTFAYPNAALSALNLDLPGEYIISARQDVIQAGATSTGTITDTPVTISSTGTFGPTALSSTANAVVYTIPVTSTATCACGSSGSTCTGTDTDDDSASSK